MSRLLSFSRLQSLHVSSLSRPFLTSSSFISHSSISAYRHFSSGTSSSPAPPYRIAMFGAPDFSVPTFDALYEHASKSDKSLVDKNTLCVITPPDKVRGRGNQTSPVELKAAALNAGCQTYDLPASLPFKMPGYELPEPLRPSASTSHHPYDLGIVVAFGYMIPDRIISSFPLGMLNIHPSLLPKYRGSSPIQAALLQGDTETGVSIMEVHPQVIDKGNVLKQVKVSIHPDDTYVTLSSRLSQLGAELLLSTLQNLSQHRSESQIQPDPLPTTSTTAQSSSTNTSSASSDTTYPRPEAILLSAHGRAPRFVKQQGELNFMLYHSTDLYNLYRGFYGFLPLYAYFITHTSTNKSTHLRCTFHKLITAQEAEKRRQDLHQNTSTATTQSTGKKTQKRKPLPSSHYPTQSQALEKGVGSVWYDSELELIGIHCAPLPQSTTFTTLYVEAIQPEYKNQMHAYDFAKSYLAIQVEESTSSKKKNSKTDSNSSDQLTPSQTKPDIVTRQFSFGPAPTTK